MHMHVRAGEIKNPLCPKTRRLFICVYVCVYKYIYAYACVCRRNQESSVCQDPAFAHNDDNWGTQVRRPFRGVVSIFCSCVCVFFVCIVCVF